VHESEVEAIRRYFVRRWGYSEQFVDRGLDFVQQKLVDYDIRTAAATLGAFARDNPDCNASVMLADINSFLREVMEADSQIDEREEMAIERVEKVFSEELRFSISRAVAPVAKTSARIAEGVRAGVSTALRKPWKRKEEET
ncbi:MAG: TerB family tellurite resistance protein, partial [Thioclava sp.]|nr:TerB family tellurite resistance protein [Thioclava sp.]